MKEASALSALLGTSDHHAARAWAAPVSARRRLQALVKRHFVTAVVDNVTNARAESTRGQKMKTARRFSKRFRAIYFHLGGLDLYTP